MSEPMRTPRIDKLKKHYGGALKAGRSGNLHIDFDPCMAKVHHLALKRQAAAAQAQFNLHDHQLQIRQRQTSQMSHYFDGLFLIIEKNWGLSSLDDILSLMANNGVNLDQLVLSEAERKKNINDLKDKPHIYNYTTSKSLQDSAECLASPIMTEMKRMINLSGFISIMADCTTDIANKIQLVINIILVNEAGNTECWFGEMYELPNEEAVTIATRILKFVTDELGITMMEIFSVGLDGCNTNLGTVGGVSTLLRQHNPKLFVFWCLAHRLNLAIKHAAEEIDAVKVFKELMHSVYQFYKKRPRRCATLTELEKAYGKNELKVIENKDNRWLTNDKASKRIYELLPIIVYELQLFTDGESGPTSLGLSKQLMLPNSLVSLAALRDVLPIISLLCVQLQYRTGEYLNVHIFKEYYDQCIDKLKDVINTGGLHINTLFQYLEDNFDPNMNISELYNLRSSRSLTDARLTVYQPFVEKVKQLVRFRLEDAFENIRSISDLFNPLLTPSRLNDLATYLSNELDYV